MDDNLIEINKVLKLALDMVKGTKNYPVLCEKIQDIAYEPVEGDCPFCGVEASYDGYMHGDDCVMMLVEEALNHEGM